MADVKGTSQEGVEKKFKDILGRSPGPFPEGTSLEKKVELIGKANRIIEAQKKRC